MGRTKADSREGRGEEPWEPGNETVTMERIVRKIKGRNLRPW